MAALPLWVSITIGIISVILLVALAFLVYKICKNRNKSLFTWIDKLGIPFAAQGQPDASELRFTTKHARVQVPLHPDRMGVQNSAYDGADRKISEAEEVEPFKRLDALGIPRARRAVDQSRGMKPPSSPLPSPLPEEEETEDVEVNLDD